MNIRTTRTSCLTLLGFALLGLPACKSPTVLEDSWKAPAVGSLKFTKVLAIALVPDGALRRSAEEAIKANIKSVPTITSYEVAMNKETLTDRTKMANIIANSGADGVIIMRPISDEKEIPDAAGGVPPPYTGMWGYYTRPYGMSGMYWDTGTASDGIVGMETNIYDTKTESLVWSGFTKSKNPKNVTELVNQVADVLRAKMKEQQLIP
jgi:hypothetical protein